VKSWEETGKRTSGRMQETADVSSVDPCNKEIVLEEKGEEEERRVSLILYDLLVTE
jgi:hypothetical protein